MPTESSLIQLAQDFASIIPSVDADTQGQYGAGIGSENEKEQLNLLFDALREVDDSYDDTTREVSYPNQRANCDIVLGNGTPVEAKLLRYWRGVEKAGPEDHWHTHIFSPFNRNTLLTDAKRLHDSDFEQPYGLLGLFYQRASDDSTKVEGLPEKFTAENLAEKVVLDIEYWYGYDAEVRSIEHFSGLQHSVHRRGAVIAWSVG